MKQKRRWIVHLVSHTHWDRAWYFPFEQFRLFLLERVGKLFELFEQEKDFRHFTLDGQTVLLEDFLELAPERETQLRELVKQGKVLVGPWYVQPDEFLVSGEALIRNLLLGHQFAEDFGKVMKVGYVPDIFGHVSQLPQILQGFGIDNCMFYRGMGSEAARLGLEFYWRAADGRSRVLTIHQRTTYGNARSLGHTHGEWLFSEFDLELALQQLRDAMEPLQKLSRTKHVLLNNGIDHAPPQPEIPELIAAAQKRFKDVEFVHSNFEQFVNGVKVSRAQFPEFQGEFRGARYGGCLYGVLSSRMYLKQSNHRCQILLEKQVEPLACLAAREGREYPAEPLKYAWRMLLRCHPHDDICGCSVDAVHRDMENRFARIEQIGDLLKRWAKEHVLNRVKFRNNQGTPFLVFNTLPWERSSIAEAEVFLPLREVQGKQVQLLNSRGEELPFRCEETEVVENPVVWGEEKRERVKIRFVSSGVPAMGYETFFLRGEEGKSKALSSDLRVLRRGMENEFYRLTINNDGTLNIVSKKTGTSLRGVHWFEDAADKGDTYDYSPLSGSKTFSSKATKATFQLKYQTPFQISYQIEKELSVPAALSKDRKRRSVKKVTCRLSTLVTLFTATPRIEFETTIDNIAQDHRLRVVFPLPFKSKKVWAESKFDVRHRAIRPPCVKSWSQPPAPTQPQDGFASLDNGRWGVSFFNKGLPEFEVKDEGKGVSYYLTLLRSVGWLARDDLETRTGNAGPILAVPEAQCLGSYTVQYALMMHHGNWQKARMPREVANYLVPLEAGTFWHAHHDLHGEKYLPERKSLLSIDPPEFLYSALKQSERGGTLILRVCNLFDKTRSATIQSDYQVRSASLVRLDEKRLKSLPVRNNRVLLSLAPREIVTVELRFK